MSDRPVKCPYCESFFRRSEEEFTYHKNRYWHKQCYTNSIQQAKSATQDKKDLHAYIEYILNKKIDARIQKQIKTFIEEYGYKYKGIQLTLEYFFEIKGNPVSKAQGGIGIVPYVYEEAKNYYALKQKAANSLNEVEGDPVTKRKVTIKDPTKQKKHLKNRTIDITGL